MTGPGESPAAAYANGAPIVVFEHDRRQPPTADSVSVAVSLYNYAQFIEPCLDSIHAQTHPHLELIVVDDASCDDRSLAVAQAWLGAHAERFERVMLLRQPMNQGCAAARNAAFGLARGNAVFVLDADNMVYPRAIARLYEVLHESGCGAAYSQLEFFGLERRLGLADIWSPKLFESGNYIDAMALVAKEAWRTVGGYADLDAWADYDFWCKFVEHGLTASFVPEILCRYRVHDASMLRASTASGHNDLIVEMSLRHAWLNLRAAD